MVEPQGIADGGKLVELAESLSDEAIIVGFGWFSFGAKASVTSNPPHANMQARQAALDELLAAGLITHEHEYHKRYRIDRHHFKGTREMQEVFGTERAQAVLKSTLCAQASPEPATALTPTPVDDIDEAFASVKAEAGDEKHTLTGEAP